MALTSFNTYDYISRVILRYTKWLVACFTIWITKSWQVNNRGYMKNIPKPKNIEQCVIFCYNWPLTYPVCRNVVTYSGSNKYLHTQFSYKFYSKE